MKSVLLFALLFGVVVYGEVNVGKCPNLEAVQNFKAADYLGVWYEYSKYSQIFESGSCSSANYSLNEDQTVKVINHEIQKNGTPYDLEGKAEFAGSTDVAKLIVHFPVQPIPAPYWVLSTDYKNYAVVWSCTELVSLANLQYVWVLTRERHPTQEVVDTAYKVVQGNNLSTKDLIKTNQENCS